MHYLEKTTQIPVRLNECWEFFSKAENLEKITPEKMDFTITSKGSESKMYEGMLIAYTLRPLFGIKMKWVSEISKIKKHQYFVDEQRLGPYQIWHHEHHFKESGDGVVMKDKLYYALPLGFLGRLLHRLLVKREVEKIFEYRSEKIRSLFPGISER